MATIIDSFLTTFGIDPKPFAEGAAEVRKETKKTREEIGASDKRLQEGGKKSREAVRGLRNELTGLFLAFAGGSSLKGFISNLISGDAAVGRLANNLGVNAKQLDAWGRMAEQAGGNAGDAAQAFTTMVQGYQSWRLDGKSPFNDDFRGLNVTVEDFKEPASALLKMSEAAERMDRAEFFERLSRIGIPASVITVLSQGRVETEKLVGAMQEQSRISQQSVAEAQAFEAAMADLSQRIKDQVRPGIMSAVGGFIALLDKVDVASVAVPIFTGLLGALAIATIAATWPYILLAAGIAGVVAGVDALIEKFPKLKQWTEDSGRAMSEWLPEWMTVPMGDLMQGRTTWAEVDAAKGAAPRPSGSARMNFQAGGTGPAIVPGGATGPEIERLAMELAPGTRVTSRQRSAEHNAKIGGKPNSRHLTNDARDFVPGRGQTMDGLYQSLSALKAQGYTVINERDHIHVQGRRGGSGAYAGAAARPGAAAAGRGFGNTVTIGQLTVQTQATDANGIARELPGALRRKAVVFNANTGLD